VPRDSVLVDTKTPILSRVKRLPACGRCALCMLLSLPVVLLSVGGLDTLSRGRLPGEIEPAAFTSKPVTPPDWARLKTIVGEFAPNGNITDTLLGHGLIRDQVLRLVDETRPVYNLARIVAGRPYWLDVAPGNDLRSFRYPLDDARYLTVYRNGDRYVPVVKSFPFVTGVETIDGVIRSSLFAAMTEAHEDERLALELAEIFMWDIDFYTDLQPGDSFRMIVEKKYLDGKFARYGAILAASFTNQRRTLTAFRFQSRPGVAEYFSADGRALKRSFLKSPLRFARVTSRFSGARMHPVLRIVRPHLGVDYAAPLGTPVVAVGAGTVASAGSTPEAGKMVRIRHAGGYETLYLHLMQVQVRAGEHVDQNQVIGRVGSTGLSTGPHLDFRVIQHGRFINPAKVIFPPSPPVPAPEFARFVSVRDPFLEQLGSTVPGPDRGPAHATDLSRVDAPKSGPDSAPVH
jgi:murein DD-endopeptidase MepM/ murein hydrolase activator NlpD